MNDVAEAIMNAAERRIRDAGYSGFSFRELATDVGVKSSSVHYHFPTKERLAATVARRYTDKFQSAVMAESETGTDPATAWKRVFRHSLVEDGRMCLCGALGTTARDLPEEVAVEVKRFFISGIEMLVASGIAKGDAVRLFANLEGAMLIANTLEDTDAFDEATSR